MLNIIQSLIIRSSNDYIEKTVIPDLLTLNPELKSEIMKSYDDLEYMFSEKFLDTQIDTNILIGPVHIKTNDRYLLTKLSSFSIISLIFGSVLFTVFSAFRAFL